jgi:hypothetical protein
VDAIGARRGRTRPEAQGDRSASNAYRHLSTLEAELKMRTGVTDLGDE